MSGLPLAFSTVASLVLLEQRGDLASLGSRAEKDVEQLVPAPAGWAQRQEIRPEPKSIQTWWTLPRFQENVRIRRIVRNERGPGRMTASWSVWEREPAGNVVLAGGLEAVALRAEENRCLPALRRLQEQARTPLQGLFNIAFVHLNPSLRHQGLARALYRDVIAIAARARLAAGPNACAQNADGDPDSRGTTNASARRVWSALADAYPAHVVWRKNVLIWGGS